MEREKGKDIRIIALDLDGTLLDSGKRLSEGNRAALAAAAANGVAGVIKQYKLVISSHAGKKEEPEPEPNTESAAQG